jgi:hypothetical protein
MREFDFKIKGLDQLQKKVNKLPQETVKKIETEIKVTVQEINEEQVRKAPVDLGRLRAQTFWQQKGPMSFSLHSDMPYAAYVEWGTGALVDVPAGLEDYAIQFKGKGIKQVNLPARPFFFSPFLREKEALKKRIESLINKI